MKLNGNLACPSCGEKVVISVEQKGENWSIGTGKSETENELEIEETSREDDEEEDESEE